jgi:protein-tyrosine phosphatase
MVWHETSSPAVIIMLTRTHELGREKCCPYFPESTEEPELNINADDEFDDGFAHNLKLVSLTEHEEARAQVRELDMVSGDGGEHKKIWHLLFAGWPDFSVPQGSDRDALLKLIEMSREKNADNESNPRIVHCSAGVGRSGTFIALDWLVQELEEGSLDNLEANEDPIYNVVDNLRKQRMMMVQAEAQLAFLYDVVREHWRERWARLHPEEADRLGLSAVQEPKQKKTKQSPGGLLDEQPPEGDEDEHAQLEAELIDAQAAFEQGKT